MAQGLTVGEDTGVESGAAAAPAARRGLSPWLVAMLALAMFVNFADRGSLAVAAPLLGRQLAIGPAAMGVLLSSFFWTYSLAQPLAGMVAWGPWMGPITPVAWRGRRPATTFD